MNMEKGTISIHTENIFPIIKKSLYADTEIFIRELASNGVDACQKLKRLAQSGEASLTEDEKLFVDVVVNKEEKTITFRDNGLGMNAEEVKKYINQIAFSGARDFLEKYQGNNERGQIIGNFGLGFYSAFMVASKVELTTRSYRPDDEGVKWTCDGSTEFTLEPSEKQDRGTEVKLFIDAESEEFLDSFRVEQVLTKYCKFLPVEVQADGKAINQAPLWTRQPAELTDKDYLDFYQQLYPFSSEPIFWIHLNVDYPFNLTGILYFPKVEKKFGYQKEKIQLYSRQVFITDEVQNVVPDYLMLLHGVIDSPDIPLNVSRNTLQTDANVRKISQYVTRKVAEKLQELFTQDRAGFETKWEAFGFFVKYGQISEPKFQEKAKGFSLLTNLEGKFFTTDEYLAKTKLTQTDKSGKVVWLYTNDASRQAPFIAPLKDRGYDVLVMDQPIDPHYISQLETQVEGVTIKRVDTGGPETIIEKEGESLSMLSDEERTQLESIIKAGMEGKPYDVKIEAHLSTDLPVSVSQNEFMLRMEEMSRNTGEANMFFQPGMNKGTIVFNSNHKSVAGLLKMEENRKKLIDHLYDIALLMQGKLEGDALTGFIKRGVDLIS